MIDADRYRLPQLDRRLQRRQGWLITTTMGAFCSPIVAIGVGVSMRRVSPMLFLLGVSVTAAFVFLTWLNYSSLGVTERSAIVASQSVVLAPTDRNDAPSTRQIMLTPERNGRHGRTAIDIDDHGMTIPVRCLVSCPRPERDADVITVVWSNIERWAVCSDSDGPDTYDIDTAQPWAGDRDAKRWPTLRIRRSLVVDEVLLLDLARSIGQISITLQASITTGSTGR